MRAVGSTATGSDAGNASSRRNGRGLDCWLKACTYEFIYKYIDIHIYIYIYMHPSELPGHNRKQCRKTTG